MINDWVVCEEWAEKRATPTHQWRNARGAHTRPKKRLERVRPGPIDELERGGAENGRLCQDILGAKRLSPKVLFKNALWWTNDAPAPAPRGLPVLKLALSLLYL